MAIRCALIDPTGLVVNVFMASGENVAIDNPVADSDGLIAVPQDFAKIRDQIAGSQTVGAEAVRDKNGKMVKVRVRKADGNVHEVTTGL